MMRIEFEKLEQRPGTHTVPVKMTREELEDTAQKMSDLTTKIEAKEEDLRSYAKDAREEIKELEDERSATNRVYRFKREPKSIAGLWGIDAEDHGRVRCKVCVEKAEKAGTVGTFADAGSYETERALKKVHKALVFPDGEAHDYVPVWERPLGTKWFVQPEAGEVYGPLPVKEADLQKELPVPGTVEIKPFSLAFDVDTAVPLLDEKERSEAEAKIKSTEKAREDAVEEGLTDLCPTCGLPLADHPELADDPCKAAMVKAADRANEEQAARTLETYGMDAVLNPEWVYKCSKCKTETFGKDLQPVTIDGERAFICASCEQGIPKGDQKKPKRKKKEKGS